MLNRSAARSTSKAARYISVTQPGQVRYCLPQVPTCLRNPMEVDMATFMLAAKVFGTQVSPLQPREKTLRESRPETKEKRETRPITPEKMQPHLTKYRCFCSCSRACACRTAAQGPGGYIPFLTAYLIHRGIHRIPLYGSTSVSRHPLTPRAGPSHWTASGEREGGHYAFQCTVSPPTARGTSRNGN